MKKNKLSIVFLSLVVILSIYIANTHPETFASPWALMPPIVAILMALITKEVYSSLFIGLVIGAILASGGSIGSFLDNVIVEGFIKAIQDNGGIFIFLISLGVMVSLINESGGSKAFGKWAHSKIKSRKQAQISTYFLSAMLFIDDYFNCLTTGSVMKPITDSYKISRAKLAYIIDATAAPICMIAPISSWAAAVSGYAEGTGLSGIEMFIRAIPFNFYSLLTLVFVATIILTDNDYGPMKEFEQRAKESGELGINSKKQIETSDDGIEGRVRDLVFPIIILIISCISSLIYVGGFFDKASPYYMDFVNAFANTDSQVALATGSVIALIISMAFLNLGGRISFERSMELLPEGFSSMTSAILILSLATSLKNISNDLLGSAAFVGNVMTNVAGSLNNFLPAVIFVVAIALAFATGTSWGTFGILIPIVASMFDPANPLFFIGISACLSGAVCGDHISPISDTTIMSSAGAGANHIDHVKTQLPYGLTVAAIAFISYIIAGFSKSATISLAFGIIVIMVLMFLIKKLKRA